MPPPHFHPPHPHPGPRPHPGRGRFYGGGYPYYPYPYETQVIEVDRTGPMLPWRVVQGSVVLFQSATMADALRFFKSSKLPGVSLQRWTGSGWQTEGGLGDSAVSEGIGFGTFLLASIAIIGVYVYL